MADEKTDDAALEPEDLDEVAGGALNAYMKLDGATQTFVKLDEAGVAQDWIKGGQ